MNEMLAYTDFDRSIWESELEDFVPGTVVDVHAHCWDDAYAACLAWTENHRGGLEILELQAKLEEHYLRDPDRALATCRRAMAILPRTGARDLWAGWDHRRRRLQMKTNKQETV